MGLFGYLCDGVTSIIKQKENQPAKTIDKSFIRKTKSDSGKYIWRTNECYVCYESFDTMPRTFPFECDHEICLSCFSKFVSYRTSNKLPQPTCGLCVASVRSEWTIVCRPFVYARKLSDTESIWVIADTKSIDINITRRNTDVIRIKTMIRSELPNECTVGRIDRRQRSESSDIRLQRDSLQSQIIQSDKLNRQYTQGQLV